MKVGAVLKEEEKISSKTQVMESHIKSFNLLLQ
jgi:hypothetical protein